MKTKQLLVARISFLQNVLLGLLIMLSVGLILSSCKKDEKMPEAPNIDNNSQNIEKSGNSSAILYYGHETFTRSTGSPVVETRQLTDPNFSYFTNQFTLNINNGNGTNNRVSSAVIKIDGVQIFGPSDFSQNVSFLTKPIPNLTANSILEIELRGKPGGILDIWIDGNLKPGFTLISPEGGILTSEDGLLTIIFPSGAIGVSKIVGVTDTTFVAPDIIEGQPVGKSYNLLPNGLHFDESLVLTWNYSDYVVPSIDYQNIGIMHISDNIVDFIPTINDLVNHEVSFNLNSFSFLFNLVTDEPWSVARYHWVIPVIKWYLEVPAGTSYLTTSNINTALNLWQSKTSSFIFERTFNESDANIVFDETHTFSDDIVPALVLALDPSLQGTVILGRTVINILISSFQPSFDEDVCATIKLASDDIGSNELAVHVLAHEIGHAIGLSHCSQFNAQCIMNYKTVNPLSQLHTWDLAALYYHYDPNNFLTSSFTDSRDGRTYQTVKIGNQWWMSENLRATKYNDGAAIANLTSNSSWDATTNGAYCWYNNNFSEYGSTYGALYNFKAIQTGKLAPIGWHIPSNEEWNTLQNYLGGVDLAGGKMKEIGTTHWSYPNQGATNECGFSGLPGGHRVDNGTFGLIGMYGNWFSSFPWPTGFEVMYNNSVLHGYSFFTPTENLGLSVRCVKD